MSFQRWRETKQRRERLGPDGGPYADRSGYAYRVGFIATMKGGGYVVHIDGSDAVFARLPAAERYLWHNWAAEQLG